MGAVDAINRSSGLPQNWLIGSNPILIPFFQWVFLSQIISRDSFRGLAVCGRLCSSRNGCCFRWIDCNRSIAPFSFRQPNILVLCSPWIAFDTPRLLKLLLPSKISPPQCHRCANSFDQWPCHQAWSFGLCGSRGPSWAPNMSNFVTDGLFQGLLKVQGIHMDSRVDFTGCVSLCGGRNCCCFKRMGAADIGRCEKHPHSPQKLLKLSRQHLLLQKLDIYCKVE
jgi:hypothetical protein